MIDTVLHYFYEISKIPRPSGHEKAISNYLVDFAKQNQLEYEQDAQHNVIIRKRGTNEESIALQAHMDMVCEKNKDIHHDFFKDPIKVIDDGIYLKADGTTLGADDGIGVAIMLAILSDTEDSSLSIEAIFTSDEEETMNGAKTIDKSKIHSKYMINLDSDSEGVLTVSSAGGLKVTLSGEIEREKIDTTKYVCYNLVLKGLKGGHSGTDINKNRESAMRLGFSLLNELIQKFAIKISRMESGSKLNAIPREIEMNIWVTKEEEDAFKNFILLYNDEMKQQYIQELNLKVVLEKTNDSSMPFTSSFLKQIVNCMAEIKNGVIDMSEQVLELVETSNNIGTFLAAENKFEIGCFVRSSKENHLDREEESFKKLAQKYHLTLEISNRYPCWEYNDGSVLKELVQRCYKRMFEKEIKVEMVHAGLECALFAEGAKLDIVSIGPNMSFIHTPDERLEIASVERMYNFLIHLLKNIQTLLQ